MWFWCPFHQSIHRYAFFLASLSPAFGKQCFLESPEGTQAEFFCISDRCIGCLTSTLCLVETRVSSPFGLCRNESFSVRTYQHRYVQGSTSSCILIMTHFQAWLVDCSRSLQFCPEPKRLQQTSHCAFIHVHTTNFPCCSTGAFIHVHTSTREEVLHPVYTHEGKAYKSNGSRELLAV